MRMAINWKPYLIFSVVISIIMAILNWKIGVGYLIGTIMNFFNLFLINKKFPKLDGKKKTVSIALIVMLFQGLLTAIMAIVTYLIGGLPCFLSSFAGMIVPHFYFVLMSLKK